MIIGQQSTDWSQWELAPAVRRAIEWLKSQDLTALEPGRIVIDGEAMYANVDEVTTRAWMEICPESHRAYIDVQYVVRGRERVGATRLDGTQAVVESHPERDLYFYDAHTTDTVVWEADAGTIYILFPEDIHRPCGAVTEPESLRKVVVKVRIGE